MRSPQGLNRMTIVETSHCPGKVRVTQCTTLTWIMNVMNADLDLLQTEATREDRRGCHLIASCEVDAIKL